MEVPTIAVMFDGTDKALIASYRERAPRVIRALILKVNQLLVRLQTKVVENLSGKILRHRTGKLAGSARIEPASIQADGVAGSVKAAGGPAWYGRLHESGTTEAYEIVPRKKKALAFFPSGSLGAGGGISQVGKKQIAAALRGSRRGHGQKFAEYGGVVVKRVMHPPITARHWMAEAREKMRPIINEELRATFVAAARGAR